MKKPTDAERARLLCKKMLRCEFSREDLSVKNVSGFSRDANQKIVAIPKLDQRILMAIFNQAKHQFPGFNEWYTDRKCQTVKNLNIICKTVRNEVISGDNGAVQGLVDINQGTDSENGDQQTDNSDIDGQPRRTNDNQMNGEPTGNNDMQEGSIPTMNKDPTIDIENGIFAQLSGR